MIKSCIKVVTIRIPDYLYEFYEKVGLQVGLSAERVMGDALFRLAGGVSSKIIEEKTEKPQASS